MNHVHAEVVVYNLTTDCGESFALVHRQIVEEFKQHCLGFVSATTLRCVDDRQMCVDLWVWESAAAAATARAEFRHLPSAKRFMTLVERVQWSGLVETWLNYNAGEVCESVVSPS